MKTNDGQLPLSVWLRLLKAHGLMLRELRRRLAGPLTLPQFDVLSQVRRRPQGMTPRELTRELLLTAGNLTGVVTRLQLRGLVERRPVPGDRRAIRVRLSRQGRQLMERAIPRHRRDVERLLAHVPAGDLQHLRELLGALNRGLETRP